MLDQQFTNGFKRTHHVVILHWATIFSDKKKNQKTLPLHFLIRKFMPEFTYLVLIKAVKSLFGNNCFQKIQI